MSITSFTYRSNLNLVYKESLSRIAAFLGVPVSKSAGKPTMIEKIDSYVKSNPIEVLEKLCVKELELLREFVKAGPDTPVVKVPRRPEKSPEEGEGIGGRTGHAGHPPFQN